MTKEDIQRCTTKQLYGELKNSIRTSQNLLIEIELKKDNDGNA
mgnify:FL=1